MLLRSLLLTFHRKECPGSQQSLTGVKTANAPKPHAGQSSLFVSAADAGPPPLGKESLAPGQTCDLAIHLVVFTLRNYLHETKRCT